MEGLTYTSKGKFWYKLISDNPQATKPAEGELLRIDYSIYKGDSLLDHSYNFKMPVLVSMPPEKEHNFFTRALALTAENDSIFVMMPADSVRPMLGEFSEAFSANDWVTFTYKNHEVQTQAEVNATIEQREAEIDSLKNFALDLSNRYRKDSTDAIFTKTKSGLRYVMVDEGAKPFAKKSDDVTAQFICIGLEEGKILQESFSIMEPSRFEVGKGKVLPAWEEAIQLVGESGKIFIVVPPHLGYGEAGTQALDEVSGILTFYIEVLLVDPK